MNLKKVYNFQKITCIILITLIAISSINLTAFASATSNINKLENKVNTKVLTKEQEFIYNDLFAPNVLENNKEEILDDSTPIKLTNDIILDTKFENLNSIILSYNEDGLNDNISDIQQNNISFEYNENGEILTSTIKDKSGKIQLVKKYKYNKAGSVESLLVENSNGIALTHYTFTYDKFDNIIMKKDNVTGKYVEYKYHKTKKFSRERYHQMTDELYYNSEGKLITKISYKYDKSGNRLKKEVKLGKDKDKLTYEYDNNQLIESSDNSSYIYDENGNINENGQLINKFNSNNQLIESKTTNNTIVSFGYNDKDHRTSKTVNNEKNNYYYMAGDIAGITDENNNLKYFFTRDEDNKLLSFVDYTSANPKTYWYILDNHQSVVGLVDQNGEKVVSYEYDGFGNITKEAGTVLTGDGKLLKDANPFKYSSYIFDDETGYYYLNARYYDPKIGRFISKDSFKDHFDTPIHQNVYLYCLNNPVNFYDPSGYILLNINSTGNDVVNIQAKLVILGHLDMTNTEYGFYGSRTYEAVKEFQKSKDLVEDGIVGNNTWNELIKQGEFYLALGSKGAKVTKMQTELNRRGYELGTIDGDFGQQTLIAVNAFKDSTLLGGNQKELRGLVGATTWYDYLFPLGVVILQIPNNIKTNQSVEITVSSKNAHHVGFEVTDPSGNKTWFGNTEGESYSAQFTPTEYGVYQILGASRNTATQYDLNTKKNETFATLKVNGIVIFQSSKGQGVNKDGSIAADMITNDFTEDEISNISLLFQVEISNLDHPEILFESFEVMATDLFSMGEMQDVLINLIDHFKAGGGADYSNEILTNYAREHSTTQDYINLVKSQFIKELKANNGNISALEYTQGNALDLYIQDNATYPVFKSLTDIFGGLTMSVHDTWGNTIDVRDYSVENNKFKGTLHFRIYDHFGLDLPDVEKKYGYLAGFRAWFVLQHYDGYNGQYKPFVTIMEFDIPFEGELN